MVKRKSPLILRMSGAAGLEVRKRKLNPHPLVKQTQKDAAPKTISPLNLWPTRLNRMQPCTPLQIYTPNIFRDLQLHSAVLHLYRKTKQSDADRCLPA